MRPGPLFVLYVADQGRSRAFYTRVLAVEPVLDVPGMTELPLGSGARLGLMPEAGIRRLIDIDTGSAAVSRAELYLPVADLDRAWERAAAAGATALSPPAMRDWGERVGYLRDPDGHVLALAQAVEGEG